ncbi:MAG: hypothetical protein N2260_10025 [Syntrophobacterales bacterium]|nr:hypothetical protein [Syntrophobacterales bacterium]
MEDDLILSLTRQVQEEIVENYLRERRLIDLQLEELDELGVKTLKKAQKTCHRFSRIGYLLVDNEFRNRWRIMVGISEDSYWCGCLTEEFRHNTRFITVTALTHKGRFKRLVHEAYKRLIERMAEYRKLYETLQQQIRAVNLNIETFHRNFDLLTIIQFLKSMDVVELERKKFLGGNFSPEELTSIDKAMYFKPAKIERWNPPSPFDLPSHELIERQLDHLASEVYTRYGWHLRTIVK